MKKVLLLRVTEKGVEFVKLPFENIEDRLAFYYNNLECETIEIQEAYGLSIPADIIIDEEGLLKDGYIINAAATLAYGYLQHGQFIVGNAMICKPVPTEDGIEEGALQT